MANTGYTFRRDGNAAIITHTDGRAWASTEGATIRWEPTGKAYRIDFNTVDITLGISEILSVCGADATADEIEMLQAITKIFTS